MRSLATACCFLALSVVACDRLVPFLQEKRAEVPPAWRGVLVAEVGLPERGAPAAKALTELLERGRAVPGVRLIAVTDTLPGAPDTRKPVDILVEGHPAPGTSHVRTISADYFRTMEILLIQGRYFTASDREGSPLVAIVNQAFARR